MANSVPKIHSTDKQVLFEPWHLGDAVIAASVLRMRPHAFALACQTRWHALLRGALAESPGIELIPVDLPYVNRAAKIPCDLHAAYSRCHAARVLGIRGDVRDLYAARRIFSRTPIEMCGWF